MNYYNDNDAKVCEWKRDGDGGYYVKCGDFRVKTPRQRDVDDNLDRNFAFCPYCGGKLRIVDNGRTFDAPKETP